MNSRMRLLQAIIR